MQVELIKMLIALFDTCDRVRIAHSLASSPSVNSMTWHQGRGVLVDDQLRLPNHSAHLFNVRPLFWFHDQHRVYQKPGAQISMPMAHAPSSAAHLKPLEYFGPLVGCRYRPLPTAMAMLPPPCAGSSNGENP